MAHKKGQGSTRNGRDSNPQFRGVKYYGGEVVRAGATIIRQCGTKFKAGYLVRRANDDGLYATTDGTVQFRGRFVDIVPADPAIPHYAAGGNGGHTVAAEPAKRTRRSKASAA